MNPLPFIAMAANCTLGSFYGQITHDWYLWCANTIGVLLSRSPKAAQSALCALLTMLQLPGMLVFISNGIFPR